jgi:alkanesulfonate monooxygenase SsuD/methylene tetrahydromethanopterin reductase-like flavin-dependent oxidoreductase (luciferase family)
METGSVGNWGQTAWVGERPLHMGIALDSAGVGLFEAERLVELARIAERADLDFVSLDDGFDPAPDRPDALLAMARIAPATASIGLVATITTTHTEPFHVSKNVATLDFVSLGRAGWRVAVSTSDEAAKRFGRKQPAPLYELYAEAADAIEVVQRLWDSWEDEAVIRDKLSGRYIDREKVHYIDFEGPFFNVRGPSITPRSPQGQPLVFIDVRDEPSRALAATRADVVLVGEPDERDDFASAAAVLVKRPIERGDAATLARDLATTTSDGFLIEPDSPATFAWFATEVAPLVEHHHPGATLRDRFGLARPANRYAS